MKRKLILVFMAAVLLCGCGYDPSLKTQVYNGDKLIKPSKPSQTVIPDNKTPAGYSPTVDEKNEALKNTLADDENKLPEKDPPQSAPQKQLEPMPYINTSVSLSQREYANNSLFVGDSICLGLAYYGVVRDESVFAAGNIGARNFFDITVYRNGVNADFAAVLEELQPKRVFFWMGMNDVNMTDEAEYCENYDKIINLTLKNSRADIIICGISPVCTDFTADGRIASFNAAMSEHVGAKYKKRVRFIDLTSSLAGSDGKLAWYFSSGDGIHLNDSAYYSMLHGLFEELKVD